MNSGNTWTISLGFSRPVQSTSWTITTSASFKVWIDLGNDNVAEVVK
jgi:hypothetical protein